MEGQISIDEFLKSKECKYSGHNCNKENIWAIADECEEECPHICCRICDYSPRCGAACNGARAFPKIPGCDEISSKAWHYTANELPETDDIYYCIDAAPGKHWMYSYLVWHKEHWWFFDSYGKKWLSARGDLSTHVIAWVEIPLEYKKTDSCLPEMEEAMLRQERWEVRNDKRRNY